MALELELDLRPHPSGTARSCLGLSRRHFWLFVGIMAAPSAFAVALKVLVESMKLRPAPTPPLFPATPPIPR